MNLTLGTKALLAFGLTGAIALGGCNSTTKSTGAESHESFPTWPKGNDEAGGANTNQQDTTVRNSGWPTMRGSDSMNWTSMAFPTGEAKTSVIGVEKGVPREVRVGQPFDTEIVVTNLTSKSVEDVVVTDQVNSTFKLSKSTPEGQMNAAGVMTWALGDFKPRETKTIRVTGTATGEGSINSCASCSYSSMLCSAIPVVSPKLRVVKTGPAEVLKCDPIVYNFEVTNTGSGTINNVKLSDALPAGLALADGKKAIDINVGTLAAGASKKFTANVTAEKTGKYDNKATASGDGITADSAVVSTVVRQPALSIDVECPGNNMIGRELTFKYTVKSTGDAASANTTLIANIPTGSSLVRADKEGISSNGKVSWNFGTLAPNDSRTVSMTVRSTAAGNLQASGTAQGVCAAAVSDACTTAIQGVPDIGISLRDDTGVRMVGENHLFTYTVKNQGQVDLTNVTMTATLSAGLEFVSSTAPTQGKGTGKTMVWNLGTLKIGQEMTFTITTKGTAAGEQSIDTVTKSDQLKLTSDAGEQVNFIER